MAFQAAALGSLIPGILDFASQNNQQNMANMRTHAGVQNALDTLGQGSSYADELFALNNNVLAHQQANNNRFLGSVNPYEASSFSYNRKLDDFYDPAFQLSVNAANDAINSSQALGGNLFSSDTANQLAAKNNVLATNQYRNAMDAMNADRNFALGSWQGNEAAKQAAANSAANVANMGIGANNALYGNMIANNSDLYGNKGDYLSALAELQASDPGSVSATQAALGALDPTGSLASIYGAGGGGMLKGAVAGIAGSGVGTLFGTPILGTALGGLFGR